MRVFMCEKCEARSRVCVCLETLCMDLMHVMDSIHSVYGVSSVIQGGLKALSPPNHGSLTLAECATCALRSGVRYAIAEGIRASPSVRLFTKA